MDDWRLRRAMRAVEEARAKAEADPMRPAFHFHPPARWMNDPNGTIHVDGYYHLFYQLNPYGDRWGTIHWGHARTRDFRIWEDLPIALVPDDDAHERHCYSGCAVLPKDGPPRILYTSVASNDQRIPYRQRSAVGSDDLVRWRKEEQPVLSIEDAPGGTRWDWRDPYVIEHDGSHLLVVAALIAHDGRQRAAILMYEALDASLSRWRYLRPLHLFEEGVSFPECPNYFRIRDRWVLIVSPCGPVSYAIGPAGADPAQFAAERLGLVDHSAEFYATNTFIVDTRVILVAWVRGFPEGRGWNGCLSMPRELGMSADGSLIQNPIDEIRLLRGRGGTIEPRLLRSNRIELDDIPVQSVELEGAVQVEDHGRAAIRLSCEDGPLFSIEFDGETSTLDVEGIRVELDRGPSAGEPISFRIFVDRSVVELFVDGGRHCVTRVGQDLLRADRLVLEATNGATFEQLQYWEMSPMVFRD